MFIVNDLKVLKRRSAETPPTVLEIEEEAAATLESVMPHYHKNEDGVLVQCYHSCRKGLKDTLGSVAFWIGLTVSYPFEHLLWERVPGFLHIAHWLGMH